MQLEDIQKKVIELLVEEFGEHNRDALNNNAGMNKIPEWDSLSFLNIVESLETTFEIKIRSSDVEELGCVEDIVKLVTSKKNI